MIVFSSAKINLGLCVRNKRSDGFHDIETVFYNLPDYKDLIEILPADSGEDEYAFYGKEIQGDLKDNLVYKAIELIRSRYPQARMPLKVIVLKNLPMGAGLGGGSSNASHTLIALNEFFELGISHEELEMMALELGSDCPFFISKKTCVAEGRGEIFTPVDIDLSPYSIQIITPDIHISTAMAFHDLELGQNGFSLHELKKHPVDTWKDILKNDFEKNIFHMFPEISAIKDTLYESGALYASLSGTGSSVYGIFPKGQKAETIEPAVSFHEFYCR